MAGLCGCRKVSSGGHCDGFGYKVILRGALTPHAAKRGSSKGVAPRHIQQEQYAPSPGCPSPTTPPTTTSTKGVTPTTRPRPSDKWPRRPQDTGATPTLSTSSETDLHPMALQAQQEYRSLWRARNSSAVDARDAAGAFRDAGVFLRQHQTCHSWDGKGAPPSAPSAAPPSAYPHQMLMSTMQPPLELRAPHRDDSRSLEVLSDTSKGHAEGRGALRTRGESCTGCCPLKDPASS